jgi:ABC-2 type transport system permease protein
MTQSSESGVIHDIGYRHYTGPRFGRDYLLLALYVDSLRGAYGLGRSAKSKIMPFLLLAATTVPALVIAIIASVTKVKELPVEYTGYAIILQTPISVFLAAQAPALVSRDLRFKIMPLYLSRPLTRADYVLAKVAAMASALLVLTVVPLIVLYVGALLAKLSFGHETKGFVQGLAGAVILSVVLAGIGLLIAGITPRRGFGVAAVITVLLLLLVVSGTLQGVAEQQDQSTLAWYATAINPFTLVDGLQVWLLGATSFTEVDLPDNSAGAIFAVLTIALVAACYGGLRLRYRKVSSS